MMMVMMVMMLLILRYILGQAYLEVDMGKPDFRMGSVRRAQHYLFIVRALFRSKSPQPVQWYITIIDGVGAMNFYHMAINTIVISKFNVFV